MKRPDDKTGHIPVPPLLGKHHTDMAAQEFSIEAVSHAWSFKELLHER